MFSDWIKFVSTISETDVINLFLCSAGEILKLKLIYNE